MITLKSGSYTKLDLDLLYAVISSGEITIPCTSICEKCDHRRVCDDINRFKRYLYNHIANYNDKSSTTDSASK